MNEAMSAIPIPNHPKKKAGQPRLLQEVIYAIN